jgi:peptide-methionine (S)-S-oxide reductase
MALVPNNHWYVTAFVATTVKLAVEALLMVRLWGWEVIIGVVADALSAKASQQTKTPLRFVFIASSVAQLPGKFKEIKQKLRIYQSPCFFAVLRHTFVVVMKNFRLQTAPCGLFRLLLWAAAMAGCFSFPAAMNADPALTNAAAKLQLATFGGGCFWCAEAVFQRIPGVKSVTSGFAGGTTANPSYEEVCTGQTGHAEVIQIQFDPSVISYDKLLEIFWEAHDPTTLNRQGNDAGTQYRSIILYSDEAQKRAAEKSKSEAARHFSSPIVTQIVPLTKFYSAEAYHQDYYNQHMHQGYCQFVIRPKLQKLIDKGVVPSGQK